MNGFLLIDKPSGINSFKLVMTLRKMTGEKSIGFAGTLDPLASGLMILALGEYTKLLPFLEAKDKVYRVQILMGKISDTYDRDGEVQDFLVGKRPDLGEIESILTSKFSGRIDQVPPNYSAIKIDGKRAYDLARKGHKFELKSRPVQIFYSKVLSYKYPELQLEVHCSSGTYVRSLAHDLGQKLGCGGIVNALRRIKIGDVSVEAACSMESLNNDVLSKYFVPPLNLLKGYETLVLSREQYDILSKGNFIDNENRMSGEILGIFEDQLVGIIETTENGSKLKFRKKLLIF